MHIYTEGTSQKTVIYVSIKPQKIKIMAWKHHMWILTEEERHYTWKLKQYKGLNVRFWWIHPKLGMYFQPDGEEPWKSDPGTKEVGRKKMKKPSLLKQRQSLILLFQDDVLVSSIMYLLKYILFSLTLVNILYIQKCENINENLGLNGVSPAIADAVGGNGGTKHV